MPVKKEAPKKSTVKKAPEAGKGKKPDLKEFLGGVEKRAYELYLGRMKSGVAGDEMSDWLQAEKEVKAKYKI
jgi:hypothetical protein